MTATPRRRRGRSAARHQRNAMNLQRRIVLPVLLLLVLTGCSHRTTGQDPHQHFIDSVDHICRQAVVRHGDHPFPVQDFDPEHPQPNQLPAVGDYFARYAGLSGVIGRLRALQPPAADAQRWWALLGTADRINANLQRQITAARAADVRTFVATVHTGRALTGRLNAAGTRFGFAGGSACEQVLG